MSVMLITFLAAYYLIQYLPITAALDELPTWTPLQVGVEIGGGDSRVSISCQLSCHAMLCKLCVGGPFTAGNQSNQIEINQRERGFTLNNVNLHTMLNPTIRVTHAQKHT